MTYKKKLNNLSKLKDFVLLSTTKIWPSQCSQCWGVRDGNEGMDCKINFLPVLRPGDGPKSVLGGHTLLLLGEAVLTPVLGDTSPWRISGISSSGTDWLCLSNLDSGRRIFGCPSFWLVYNPEEDPPMLKTEDRGGLFFDENGSETICLEHKLYH